MSDLSVDTKAQLADFAAKLRAKAEAQQPAPDPVQELVQKIDNGNPEQPKAEETPKDEAVPTKEEPKAESTKVADPQPTEGKEETEEVEFKWDEGVVTEEPKASTLDIKKLGSALELDVNTEEELVSTVKQQKQRLKELEEAQTNLFDGVDSELKEALDLAKKGGDWKSFIGNSIVDATQLDPVELFEAEFERLNSYKYQRPDGTIDWEKLDEDMDAIPDSMKSMQGEQIKNNIYLNQQQKKEQAVKAAIQQQEVFTSRFSEALKELPKAFPKETFGINIESKHVASLYDGVTSGKLVQKHLGVDTQALIRAGVDPKKLTQALAKAEWSEGIAKFQYTQGKTQAKRELLEKTQNVQITSPGVSAKPEPSEAEKPKSAAQKIAEQMTALRPAGSL